MGATGALHPRSTWAPIAYYYLYFDTPLDRMFIIIYIYILCSLSLMVVVVVDVVVVVVAVFVFARLSCYLNTPALAYVELLLCSSACASIPFISKLDCRMRLAKGRIELYSAFRQLYLAFADFCEIRPYFVCGSGAGERRNRALSDLLPVSFWPLPPPPFWK
jgi:hypothetical protein